MRPGKSTGTISSGGCSPLWPVAAIFAISMAVYFNALQNGFVWDDADQILTNAWIRDPGRITEIFTKNVWSFNKPVGNYYRPLMYVAFMAEYLVFRLNPAGFHLVNMLFNAGASVMAYLIAKRFYPSAAFVAAVLFAVNPLHTEAVTWVSGFTEVSFAFFYLLSLYFYMNAADKGPVYAYTLSAVFFFISLLCKETALTLPLVILCYEHIYLKSKAKPAEYLKRYAPFLLAMAVYLALRLFALKGLAPERHHPELTDYECLVNVPPLFANYLYRLLFPVNLNVLHVYNPIKSLLGSAGLFPVGVALAFLALACASFRKDRAVFFYLSLVAIPLLPVLYLRGHGGPAFAERYLYLPSLGFSMLFASVAGRLQDKPGLVPAMGLVVVLVAGLYCAGTITRNRTWKDNLTLWSDAVRMSPDVAMAHNNLGCAYLEAKAPDEAAAEFRAALKLSPALATAHNNLGGLYLKKGLLDKAEDEYKAAVRSDPYFAKARSNLGYVYFTKGLQDRAETELKAALRINPDLADAHNNLGQLYFSRGMLDESVEELRAALKPDPGLADVHYNLGVAYSRKGLSDMAVDEYRTALRSDPGNAEAHYYLGLEYAKMGLHDRAAEEYQIAVKLNPGLASASGAAGPGKKNER